MGHLNWWYTSEAEMAKTGKKRERSGSGEKEHGKKKAKHAPINCAICESKGEVDLPAFSRNRELFVHVVQMHLEERYKCIQCQKNTDRAHVSEYGKSRHPCFQNSQPFRVLELAAPYTVLGAIKILRRHFPELPPNALKPYLDLRQAGLAEKYSRRHWTPTKSMFPLPGNCTCIS